MLFAHVCVRACVSSLMQNFVDLACLAVICQLLMNSYVFLRKSIDLMDLHLRLLTPILKVTCCQYQTTRTLLKHCQQHSHCWEFLSIIRVSSKSWLLICSRFSINMTLFNSVSLVSRSVPDMTYNVFGGMLNLAQLSLVSWIVSFKEQTIINHRDLQLRKKQNKC